MGTDEVERILHPSLETLALYSNSDLSWREHWRVKRHLGQCQACEHHVARFRTATGELKHEANTQTLTGYEAIADWKRLEREMLGNIAVGLAAARCIDNVGRKRAFISRGAAVVGLMILFVAGWVTHIPREQTSHLFASLRRLAGMEHQTVSGTVVRTTPDGIAVKTPEATLVIMHPRSAVVSLSGSSAVAARYVDEETGQVTIANVYGQ